MPISIFQGLWEHSRVVREARRGMCRRGGHGSNHMAEGLQSLLMAKGN